MSQANQRDDSHGDPDRNHGDPAETTGVDDPLAKTSREVTHPDEQATVPTPRPPAPALFSTPSGVLVLADVSSVQCYLSGGSTNCRVVFRSGASIDIDMQYSRLLIEAVKAHHVRPHAT
jgi:hypothetical protein